MIARPLRVEFVAFTDTDGEGFDFFERPLRRAGGGYDLRITIDGDLTGQQAAEILDEAARRLRAGPRRKADVVELQAVRDLLSRIGEPNA